jgi:CDP-paratose 2-epimerase
VRVRSLRRLHSIVLMAAPICLVTGSSGLIGSAVVEFMATRGAEVHGVDSNQRGVFFGQAGDTRWNEERLRRSVRAFQHHAIDVRDRPRLTDLVRTIRPSLIVHAAAQPSHDRAADIACDDFEINALGTLNLLEAARAHCPDAPLVFMSTNKVYGDRPNTISLDEQPTRWEYGDPAFGHGIAEDFTVDQSTHSLFGVSKLSADLLVQEYGRYFGMPTCCLRAGCVTGPHHSAVELHGFLSYLVKCNVEGREYRVYGYKGKQVRDNIHAVDIAAFIHEFWRSPRVAEVYNVGGGKANSCSILEAFDIVASLTGRAQVSVYIDQPRRGDHICYYSDLRKMKAHYPGWRVTMPLLATMREIVETWHTRISA